MRSVPAAPPRTPALAAGIDVLGAPPRNLGSSGQGRRGWPGRSPAMTAPGHDGANRRRPSCGTGTPALRAGAIAVPRMRRSAQRCGADPGRLRHRRRASARGASGAARRGPGSAKHRACGTLHRVRGTEASSRPGPEASSPPGPEASSHIRGSATAVDHVSLIRAHCATSCPRPSRASTSFLLLRRHDVDGRDGVRP